MAVTSKYGIQPCACGCGEMARGRFTRAHAPKRGNRFPIRVDERGCWIWEGSKSRGYGYIRIGEAPGRLLLVHRLYYEQMFGRIPVGMDLDHLCRTPACVNPGHLEAVTHAENMRRGKNVRFNTEVAKVVRWAARNGLRKRAQTIYGMNPGTVSKIVRGLEWR